MGAPGGAGSLPDGLDAGVLGAVPAGRSPERWATPVPRATPGPVGAPPTLALDRTPPKAPPDPPGCAQEP